MAAGKFKFKKGLLPLPTGIIATGPFNRTFSFRPYKKRKGNSNAHLHLCPVDATTGLKG